MANECSITAEAHLVLPFCVHPFESQNGISGDANDVLPLHLADLFHQFGGAVLLVKLHVDLVDGPGAEERVGLVVAGAQGEGKADE